MATSQRRGGSKPKWGDLTTTRIVVPKIYADRLEQFARDLMAGIEPETRLLVLPSEASIEIARGLAIGYARNKRTRLMDASKRPTAAIAQLKALDRSFWGQTEPLSIDRLQGYCGRVAAIYWGSFGSCLKFPGFWAGEKALPSSGNLCLEFLDRRLVEVCGEILSEVGISADSQGFLHGKLAADLAFVFEAQVRDTCLVNAVNLAQIFLKDFEGLEELSAPIKAKLDRILAEKLATKSQGGLLWRETLVAESKKILLAIEGILPYEPIIFRNN